MSLYFLAAVAAVVLVALITMQIYRVVIGYRKATGTPWQRFLAAFSYSHTILLSRLVAFGAAILAFIQSALPLLDPGTQAGLAVAAIFPPQYAPVYIAVLMLIVEWVRKRGSSVDPILPPPQAVVIPPSPTLFPTPTPPTPPAPVGTIPVLTPTDELTLAQRAVPTPGSIVDTHV